MTPRKAGLRTIKRSTEVRREQIARAALDLITRGGLKALSVASVAAECGLVPSAVYRHFKGKEEIIDAVLDLVGNLLEQNAQAACAETEGPEDCLRRLYERHIAMIRQNRGIPRLVLSDEIYEGQPDRKARVFAVIARYLGRLQSIIQRAQAAGTMSTAHPPATFAYLFLGLVQPAAILWHLSDGRADIARQSGAAWEAYRDLAFPGTPEPELSTH